MQHRRWLLAALFGGVLAFSGVGLAEPESLALSGIGSDDLPQPNLGDDRKALPSALARSLNEIVQPITTITTRPDGIREVNMGSGFVVGRRYYTVQHNLAPLEVLPRTTTITYLDGVPIRPRLADATQDIAVFDLTDDLCRRYCNHLSFDVTPSADSSHRVVWLRKFGGERIVRQALVRGLAFLGDGPLQPAPVGCAANVVVEVDQPFHPGSSGAPVLDARTGAIIGIIQGSFDRDGIRSGFFKPIQCVLSSLGVIA